MGGSTVVATALDVPAAPSFLVPIVLVFVGPF